jgi:DNA-binding transcriptional LysR family regulator
MKLHQLRDVIAAAELGSLRSAARHLNIAQSAITKSIRQLEKELDVQLFERHKQGVIVTAMGTLFVERARTAMAALRSAQDDIRQHRGDGTGEVAVAVSTVPTMALLPSIIPQFTQRYPRVRLTLHEALGFQNAEPLMRTGATDVYVGISPATKLSSEYEVEPLFRNQRYVIARAGHPLATARSLRELIDANWLVSSSTAAEANLLAFFRKNHCKAPERLTNAGSILSQVMLLLNSDMLMIGPKQLLELMQHRGRLVRVPIREKIEAPTVVMIRRSAWPLTPAAETFCDLVRRASVRLRDSAP